MRKSLLTVALAALAVGFGATVAFADFQSATACKKAQAWDASAVNASPAHRLSRMLSCSNPANPARLAQPLTPPLLNA